MISGTCTKLFLEINTGVCEFQLSYYHDDVSKHMVSLTKPIDFIVIPWYFLVLLLVRSHYSAND